MAGKVTGARVQKSRGKSIPSKAWEDRNLAGPPEQRTGDQPGIMVKNALEKSRNAKGIAKGI